MLSSEESHVEYFNGDVCFANAVMPESNMHIIFTNCSSHTGYTSVSSKHPTQININYSFVVDTKRDVSPEEAITDPNFCCYVSNDGMFKLKRSHKYYHHVQLQLYVASDSYRWCDFCIYTTKGVLVERIFSDSEWITKKIPQLTDYFESEILPEIAYPIHKPSHYL